MRLPRRILACTDFSANGDEAVAYAAQLARALDAELVVAHLFNGFVIMQRELLRSPSDGETEARRAAGLERLQELVARVGGGVPARFVCEHADARTEIPHLARREGCELIVVGRYGQSGFAHLFVGSVTDSVVRNASVPVLAVGNGVAVEKHAPATTQHARHHS